jgi:hypothetical protein
LFSGNTINIFAQNKYKSSGYKLVLTTKQEIEEIENIKKLDLRKQIYLEMDNLSIKAWSALFDS